MKIHHQKSSRNRALAVGCSSMAALFWFTGAGSSSTAPGGGYLPATGPVQLRVMPPARFFTNVVIVQQIMAMPAPVVAEPPPKPVEFLGPPAPEPGAVTNEVITSVIENPKVDDVVSPQMLLQYFNKSTNGTVRSVIAPVDFTPPSKASETSGSKATYSIGQ